MRMSRGPTGSQGITSSDWRAGHPSWNGGYFYNNGAYYYDAGFSSPAIVLNEWAGIAVLAGGVAFEASLNSDPTLVFAGALGVGLAITAYDADQHSGNGEDRLRWAYFSKPYFWRSGARYDRISVVIGGVPSYQFRRH